MASTKTRLLKHNFPVHGFPAIFPQDVAEQDSDALREELQRSRDEFPPHDSEDSLGPEHIADELRRLVGFCFAP